MTRPVVLTLFLTHQCNLRCTYCYVHDKRNEKMPLEVGQKAIDLSLPLVKNRLQISFFGGEPLIEWDLLTALHAYGSEKAKERGISPIFALTTNGLLLDEERLAFFRDNDVRMGFSIDGNKAAQDATRPKAGGSSSWERTADRLALALTYLPDLQTISVIDPSNVEQLAESVRTLIDLGVRRLTLNPNWSAPEWEKDAPREVWEEQYERISELYIERFRAKKPVRISFIEDKVITRLKSGYAGCDRCDFGKLDYAVSTSGKIYPCERQVGADGPDEAHMVIGTVDEGFDSRRQRDIQRAVKQAPEECKRCALAPRCANWCPCANLALTGEMGKPGGLLCFHEQLSVKWADHAASTLYAEKNAAFMTRFYS